MTCDLRLGSCLDPLTGLASLADRSVDHVITDPPYEAEAHEKGKRQNPGNGGGKEERGKPYVRVVDESYTFNAITETERTEVALQSARVARRWVGISCQVEAVAFWKRELVNAGLLYRRAIPWVKPDAMPSLHGRWPGQSVEMIVFAAHPGVTAPVGGKARYYEVTKERGLTRSHPTAKPLELMRQILEDFTRPGDLVCDPFTGSGSTGAAALRLGRNFLGWELSPEYHAIATRRLNGDEAKPRECQPGLFDALTATR